MKYVKEREAMAEKRDYYEVLGVDKNADDATIKKHTDSWPRNITLTLTREIRMLKPNSRRQVKPTPFCQIRKNVQPMTNTDMLHLIRTRLQAELLASADTISAEWISLIYSVICSVLAEASEALAEEATEVLRQPEEVRT